MGELTGCDCLDCGGTKPAHDPHCQYMVTMHGLEDRDMEKEPYTNDEKRVADYISLITDGQVGAGSDPIGFLLASHSYTMREKKKTETALTDAQKDISFMARWVERGLYDKHISPKEALGMIAHYPGMPWSEGRWDVDHKDYAEAFYKDHPKARGEPN